MLGGFIFLLTVVGGVPMECPGEDEGCFVCVNPPYRCSWWVGKDGTTNCIRQPYPANPYVIILPGGSCDFPPPLTTTTTTARAPPPTPQSGNTSTHIWTAINVVISLMLIGSGLTFIWIKRCRRRRIVDRRRLGYGQGNNERDGEDSGDDNVEFRDAREQGPSGLGRTPHQGRGKNKKTETSPRPVTRSMTRGNAILRPTEFY